MKSRGYGRLVIDDESIVKMLKLKEEIHSEEFLLHNVRVLLLKDGYFQTMKIDVFTKWLE